mmetsp:Transcript_98289/g.273390  ORF Transcript_98289/g.273390 Transcript_98289/m.273390 type:complete len:347 (-) Transcript_98289:155-1195(-)
MQRLLAAALLLAAARVVATTADCEGDCCEAAGSSGAAVPLHVVSLVQHTLKTSQPNALIGKGKLPVWVWWDYPAGHTTSGLVRAAMASWKAHAPDERFEFRFVNTSNVERWLPNAPEEFKRLPYPAAASDFVRAGLLAEHGGLYLDTDILLRVDLEQLLQKLNDGSVDIVTYENSGQSCEGGSFSSNFLAGRKGNALSKAWYEEASRQLKTSCPLEQWQDMDSRQGVCCYTPSGAPRTCHIPWGGLGERIGHRTLRAVLAAQGQNGFKGLHCFRERLGEGFGACESECLWEDMARGGNAIAGLYERPAYHLFGSNAKMTPTMDELLHGKWVISELVRKSLQPAAEA